MRNLRLFTLIASGLIMMSNINAAAAQQGVPLDINDGSILCRTNMTTGTEYVSIRHGYPTSRADECIIISDTEVTIVTESENTTNDSPWYSFHVKLHRAFDLTLNVKCDNTEGKSCTAKRFWPHISTDGETWSKIDPCQVTETQLNEFKSSFLMDQRRGNFGSPRGNHTA